VLCLSRAALASRWVAMERGTVMFQDPANEKRRLIPLLLEDCELPDTLRRLAYVDFRHQTEAAFRELTAASRPEERRPMVDGSPIAEPRVPIVDIPDPTGDIEGIVPVERIHTSTHRLPGEVFAIELLQRPIEIIRQPNGRFRIIIDRRGVRHAAITTNWIRVYNDIVNMDTTIIDPRGNRSDHFGSRFFTEEGQFKCTDDPQIFTPAAAKVLSLYFAQTP
jgi:hypothetical protein